MKRINLVRLAQLVKQKTDEISFNIVEDNSCLSIPFLIFQYRDISVSVSEFTVLYVRQISVNTSATMNKPFEDYYTLRKVIEKCIDIMVKE